MNCTVRSILRVFATGSLLTMLGYAQSNFGSITGTVTDPSGAVVPGADVVVTNQGTATTRRVTSTPAGLFSVPNLDTGTYNVRITAKGFSSYEREDLVLMANQIIDRRRKTEHRNQLAVGGSNTSRVRLSRRKRTTSRASCRRKPWRALPLVGRHAGDYGIYTYTTFATGRASSSSSPYPQFQGHERHHRRDGDDGRNFGRGLLAGGSPGLDWNG